MEQKQAAEHGRLGKYELLERLGHGGMGEVWKARDTQLQRYVAIKLLRAELQDDPDFVAYFMREARLVAALRHPSIVQIHDFQSGGTPGKGVQAYMVMDYIEGGTLASAIRETVQKGIFWSANDIVDLFATISLALDYAHGQGMIHRDIKPANILLDQSLSAGHMLGDPVLTDFGIARWQGGGSTLTGFVGTPLYISPEQAQSRPVDARSDLYSLGIVLYEVLTGITPFRGNNPLGVMLQHVEEPPPLPSLINPLVSPALSAVVLRSIAKDPRERFPSATAMTIALAQAFVLPVPAMLEHVREKPAFATDYNPLQPSPVRPGFTPSHSSSAPSSLPIARNHPEAHSPFTPSAPDVNRLTPIAQESPRLTPPYMQPPQIAGVSQQAGTVAAHMQAPQSGGAFHSLTQGAQPLPSQSDAQLRRAPLARKWVLVVSLLCVLALLSGLGVVVIPRLFPASGASTSTTNGQVAAGQLLFLSNSSAAQGTFNEVQIDIRNVSPPPAGQVYYAWLTQANSEALSVPHWALQVSNGTIHDLYTSPSPQTNLLTGSNLLLITTENTTSSPVVPYTSPARHYYYANITHSSTSSPTFVIKSCPTSNTNDSANPCR